MAAKVTRQDAELCDLRVLEASQAEAPPPTPSHMSGAMRRLSSGKHSPKSLQPQHRSMLKGTASDHSPQDNSPERQEMRPEPRSSPSADSEPQDATVVVLRPKAGDLKDNPIHQQTVLPSAGTDGVSLAFAEMAVSAVPNLVRTQLGLCSVMQLQSPCKHGVVICSRSVTVMQPASVMQPDSVTKP